jgi:hypothetical protein
MDPDHAGGVESHVPAASSASSRFDRAVGVGVTRMRISSRDVPASSTSLREEHEMFIFHDVVDLFALFGLVHFGRVVLKRRHKVS